MTRPGEAEATVTLARAYALAAEAHADQTRKGKLGIPYVNHCCEVARLVAEAGGAPEIVAAAVLHDVVEDSDVTVGRLREAFGARVAETVEALTNPPEWDRLPRPEMKARQAKHVGDAGPEVRLIKIADQTSNVSDIAREPGAWTPERARAYIEGAALVVDACRGVDAGLEAAFDAAVGRARAALSGSAEESPS